MSQCVETPTRTFTSGAALAEFLRVTLSSGTTVLAGAGDAGIGTVHTPSLTIGDAHAVRMWNSEGTRKMIASGAITSGNYVYAAASGKVASSGTIVVGIALETTTADGDVFEVFPITSGSPGGVRVTRQRFTIAQVNAGATILTAIPGRSFRMHDAALISVGGSAAAVTTVDIIGTLSTTRKLMAGAQASLTQSTLLRAGASGGTILADGASFTANDPNTAITIGITGSSVTTATHIDVLLTYSIE